MCIVNKHPNYEEQLLAIADNDGARFELLSLIIDWGLQRISRLSDDVLYSLEVARDVYIIKIEKSFAADSELKVMFEYIRGENHVTLLAVRTV